MFKSGYIAIIGQPNVGKSTLLNVLLGQKIAAVTPKPQTTRHRILGIKHLPQGQILFLDTPGIHHPHKSLNEYMMEVTRTSLSDADIFLFLIEAADSLSPEDEEIFKSLAPYKKPILLVINKSDRSHPAAITHLAKRCQQQWNPVRIVSISAKTEKGIQEVETEILKRLPEGPAYFPEDQVTDQTERFLAAEIIREKVMELTREEIPYSVTVQVEA
ncbi:MAG: GTPase Era, partial [Deltaproteobacteria bacterium]|nr:GTPase Era [Deltaproteobacteria bacterium]